MAIQIRANENCKQDHFVITYGAKSAPFPTMVPRALFFDALGHMQGSSNNHGFKSIIKLFREIVINSHFDTILGII